MLTHTRTDSAPTQNLTADFIGRYAIVGGPQHCIQRLEALAALGIGKVVVIGSSPGSDLAEARLAEDAIARDVLPAFDETQV